MRSVVVGGMGFLGGALVNDLCSRGDEVTVLDIKPAGTGPVRPWGSADVPHVQGDIRDPEVLLRAFRGADEVYHMAGKLGTNGTITLATKELARYPGHKIEALTCLSRSCDRILYGTDDEAAGGAVRVGNYF